MRTMIAALMLLSAAFGYGAAHVFAGNPAGGKAFAGYVAD